jgi:hypothetical protein
MPLGEGLVLPFSSRCPPFVSLGSPSLSPGWKETKTPSCEGAGEKSRKQRGEG